jgi:hypothetical protein
MSSAHLSWSVLPGAYRERCVSLRRRCAGDGEEVQRVASTLCPSCGERVEHPSNYAISVVETETAGGLRTKLVANSTIVIHACMKPADATP